MKPGRELDKLVAEKVMGWKSIGLFEVGHGAGVDIVSPTGQRYYHSDGYAGETPYPHYSTDIAAAWRVVEKIKGDKAFAGSIVLQWDCGQWEVGYQHWDEVQPLVSSDSAAHAICLAALKSVEDGVPG